MPHRNSRPREPSLCVNGLVKLRDCDKLAYRQEIFIRLELGTFYDSSTLPPYIVSRGYGFSPGGEWRACASK